MNRLTLYTFIFCSFLHFSCNQKSIVYTHDIYVHNKLDVELLENIDDSEKALLLGYLFMYGNECLIKTDKIKCRILETLQIEDECDIANINFLKKWFKNDILMPLKLKKCPNLPHKSAIQNTIKQITTKRNSDTISITMAVVGMNTSQEKSWDIKQTESYIIKDNSFIKK